MFVACSPHIFNRSETIRALRFAVSAKKVKNKAKKNEEQSTEALKKRIKELELQVSTLKAELVEERAKKQLLGRHVSKLRSPSNPQNVTPHYLSPPINPVDDANAVNAMAAVTTKPTTKPGPIPNTGKSPKKRVGFFTDSGDVQYPVIDPTPKAISTPSPNMAVMARSPSSSSTASSESLELSMQTMDYEASPPVNLEEIMKVESEQEFNYIQEISDLRSKLEEMDKVNRELHEEIASKNDELEQCNNRMARLRNSAQRMSLIMQHDQLALLSSDDDSDTAEPNKSVDPTLSSGSLQLPLKVAHSYASSFSNPENREMLEFLMKLQEEMPGVSDRKKYPEDHFNRLDTLDTLHDMDEHVDDDVDMSQVTRRDEWKRETRESRNCYLPFCKKLSGWRS